jgi:DNA-directed RNA polymerase subunit beta
MAGRSRSSPTIGAGRSRLRHRQWRERRSRVPGRPEDQPARRQQGGQGRAHQPADPDREIFGRYSAYRSRQRRTGEIYIEAGDECRRESREARPGGIDRIELLDIDHVNTGAWIRNTLKADKAEDRDSALSDIYRVMRPGEPPTRETADALFAGLFFDPERYDLSAVGRVKLNMRLDLDVEDTVTTLRKEDILAVVKTLVGLKDGKGEIDDIDNLGNRACVRSASCSRTSIASACSAWSAPSKERHELGRRVDRDAERLINAKPAVAAVREFFGSSQLSQFMDQTNPLSEVTHKRRVSALGPGGLTRERAGFEVRDVHPTHYGRICPIETPEGPNIGLINSLASFSRVNKYGFIETPYRKVVDNKVTDDVVYLSRWKRASTRSHRRMPSCSRTRASARRSSLAAGRRLPDGAARQITLMDVSPKQARVRRGLAHPVPRE